MNGQLLEEDKPQFGSAVIWDSAGGLDRAAEATAIAA